jgi:hypothetical protein
LGLKKKEGSAIFYLEKTKNTTPNIGIKIKQRALRYFLFREDQKQCFFFAIKKGTCARLSFAKKTTPIFVMKKATGALRFFYLFRQGQKTTPIFWIKKQHVGSAIFI